MRARWVAVFLVAMGAAGAASGQTLSNPPGANPPPAPPPASVVPPPQDTATACMPASAAGPSRLHVEVRGSDGLYAGSETVLVSEMSGQPVVSVTCSGPFANFRLAPGRYRIRAFIGNRVTNEVALAVPENGARAVLQFPPEPSRDDEVL